MTIARFPVEAGPVMMFARSIGDPNPAYYDDDYPLRPTIGAA
ncbi:MAG: hypothetical protein SGJ13_13150 [Actinomycetota bacterium]|nr:hypothetical protein [Actinomycetota bacterium]